MRWTAAQLQNHPKHDELLGIKPHQKASDAQLIAAYTETKSIWKTAEKFNMCGQSVWERLVHLNAIDSTRFTPEQEQQISAFYNSGFKKGELKAFCTQHGFLKTSVSRWARELGLTNRARPCSPTVKTDMSARSKAWLEINEHPRGMIGKKHSETTREAIGEASIRAAAKMTPEEKHAKALKMLHTKATSGKLLTPRKGSWKQGWYTIGNRRIFLRSRWEVNYACYLEFRKKISEIKDWEYEPETFWFKEIKRGTTNYTPDFKVVYNNNSFEFHEVKGWMDARSRTKLKRMRIYHSEIKMVVIDAKWFKEHKALKNSIPGWISCRF